MESSDRLVLHIKSRGDISKLRSFSVRYRRIDIIIEDPGLSKKDVIEMLRDDILMNHFRSVRIWMVNRDENRFYNNLG